MSDFFTIKLDKIKITDNRELGKAEVNVFCFVTSSNTELPNLDALNETTKPTEKKAIIKSVAEEVLSSRFLSRFDNISDNQDMVFGNCGLSIYTSNTIPEDVNILIALIENDEDIRAFGTAIDSILNDESFNNLSDMIIANSSVKTDSKANAGVKIMRYVAEGVSSLMKNKKDDQIDIFMCSLNKYFDYTIEEYHTKDAPGVCGNVMIDYSVYYKKEDESIPAPTLIDELIPKYGPDNTLYGNEMDVTTTNKIKLGEGQNEPTPNLIDEKSVDNEE